MSSQPNITPEDAAGPPNEQTLGKFVARAIVYDLPPHETAAQKVDDLLRETTEKFATRATRFGQGASKTASDVNVIGARRAHVRGGFITGFDMSTEAEKQKRESRKKRFETGPEIDDPEKRRSRAERFGVNAAAVKEGNTKDPLESRRDVAIGELMRPNIIHAFGVDTMSTKEVMTHFQDYGPSWCEWLNDSSCNIAFEDEHTMKRVLNDATMAPEEEQAESSEAPVDKMGDGEGDGASMKVAGDGSLPGEAKWCVARPFMKGAVRIPLWVRQASEQDTRPNMPNPKSHWSRSIRRQRHQQKTEGRRGAGRRPIIHPLRAGSEETGVVARSTISLGVRKDKASSIMKARMKKVSREDLNKALAS